MGDKRKADWNKFRVENTKRREAAAQEKEQKQEAVQIPMALARPLPMMVLAQPLSMMQSAYPLLSTPTSHVFRVVLAQPVPIQATTSVAAYVTAPATEAVTDAAAAAQELAALEVLSTLASARAEAEAEAEVEVEVEAEAEAEAEADAQAHAEADARAQADADAQAQAEADAQAHVEAYAAEILKKCKGRRRRPKRPPTPVDPKLREMLMLMSSGVDDRELH
jgi:hypothetical protein